MDQNTSNEVTAVLEAVTGTLEAENGERNAGTSEAENLERTNIASEDAPGSSRRDTIATSQELKLKNICTEELEDLNVASSLSGRDNLQAVGQSRWQYNVKGKSPININNGSIDTSSYGDAAGGGFLSKEMPNIPTSNGNEVGKMENQLASSKVITPAYQRTKIFSRTTRHTLYYMKGNLMDKGTISIGPKDINFGSSPQIVDTSAPSNSNREVALQGNSDTLLNSNRSEIVRPPAPHISSHSGTPIPPILPTPDQLTNREIVGPPPHIIPHPAGTPMNREIVMPPPQIIQHQGTPVNTNIPPIPNQFANINRIVHRPRTRAFLNHDPQNIVPIMELLIPPIVSNFSNYHTVRPPNTSTETYELHQDSVSLREWLNFGGNKGNKVKSMYIFKQILNVVGNLHSEAIVLLDLRPSYFTLLQSYEVTYIGSNAMIEKVSNSDPHYQLTCKNEKRPMEHGDSPSPKKIKPGENTTLVTSSNPKPVSVSQSNSKCEHMSDSSESLLGDTSGEVKWYASPEDLSQSCCILSSNIYSLGVLLYELLSTFDSESDHDAAMFSLRDKILPPNFLSENPKEAELCLSLLHPEATSRPTIREILESDVVNESEDLSNLSHIYDDEDVEMDVLQHFLECIEPKNHKRSLKLMEEIKLLEGDIKEVVERQKNLLRARGKEVHQSSFGVNYYKSTLPLVEENIMMNIEQLESVYFSMRSTVENSNNGPVRCNVHELQEGQETSYHTENNGERNESSDGLGVFYESLSKCVRYTKFKVRGTLRSETGFRRYSSISNLSFDANEEYFSAAGASKKIKIYDFHNFLDGTADLQYPLVVLSNESELSCTTWNNYINNYIASSDYKGVVKLWDVGASREVLQFTEHVARAWSVDFSAVDPTILASAGDDGCLKLWKINEKNSITTFQCQSFLCCVQFSAKSSHLIACGSSDSNTYCIDLRNASVPYCVLDGHSKPVNNIRFLDSHTLVSASTDDTMKIWDLNSTVADKSCILTLRGHTNLKSFVGLSVSDDGYIVCGSETNEVFAYHRSLPMPITSQNFGSIDVVTGEETYDDDNQDQHFVTSVCWRNQSEMVIAANSSGTIKLLQIF